MGESMSNSDLLRREQNAFSRVSMPLNRKADVGGEELPFVVGVLDDLSGGAGKPKAALEERKFDKVTRYTLDQKMAEIGPGLEYDVKSTLPDSVSGSSSGRSSGNSSAKSSMHVKLKFSSMKDFEPQRVATQVPVLDKLVKLRDKLVSLRSRPAVDPALKKELEQLISEIVTCPASVTTSERRFLP